MSSITRSGRGAAVSASARRPWVATFTRYPRSSSMLESNARFAGVSSTIRIVAGPTTFGSVSSRATALVSTMVHHQHGFDLLETEGLDHLAKAAAEVGVQARDPGSRFPGR